MATNEKTLLRLHNWLKQVKKKEMSSKELAEAGKRVKVLSTKETVEIVRNL